MRRHDKQFLSLFLPLFVSVSAFLPLSEQVNFNLQLEVSYGAQLQIESKQKDGRARALLIISTASTPLTPLVACMQMEESIWLGQ